MRHLMLTVAIVFCQASGAGPSKTKTLSRFVENDVRFFKEMLARDKVDFRQIRSRAVVIALAAHFSVSGKPSPDRKFASLRHHAIRLAETTSVEEAKRIVEGRFAEEEADFAKVPAGLQMYLDDLSDLHNLMKPTVLGGLGIDFDVSRLAKGEHPLTKEVRQQISDQAYRTAVIAQATESWFANKFRDKKIAKALQPWAVEMGTAAKQLTIAVASESDLEVRQDAARLSVSCLMCHRFFVNGIIPPQPGIKKQR